MTTTYIVSEKFQSSEIIDQKFAIRAKNREELRLILEFHYSDFFLPVREEMLDWMAYSSPMSTDQLVTESHIKHLGDA